MTSAIIISESEYEESKKEYDVVCFPPLGCLAVQDMAQTCCQAWRCHTRTLCNEEILPLDVLLIWHTYFLNPHIYTDDTMRVHPEVTNSMRNRTWNSGLLIQ